MKLVHWPLTGGLLHLVQRGGDGAPPSRLLAVPNVTAHPSTASVPTVLLYNGPLLYGFNVAIVEFYLYPTVGTVLIHSVKPELTE